MNLRIAFILIALSLPNFISAQEMLSGTVKDEYGQPLGFATIKLLSGDNVIGGAVADSLGNFSISTPDSKSYKLQITYAGNSIIIDDVNQEKITGLIIESGVEIETKVIKVKNRGKGSKTK
jgi:hypothetical protein